MKSLLIIFLLYSPFLFSSEIKIISPRSNYDTNYYYFYDLLNIILQKSEKEYGKSKLKLTGVKQQGRALEELKEGENIDIHWIGTNLKREKELLPIRIPLIKGLLGYRVFITHKNKIELFNNISTFTELKRLKACQGSHWPDTKILENSSIKVIKNTNYELLFLQTAKNRCDYFPRGLNEAYTEITSRKELYPSLVLYDDIILYYPFPMYFFVNKNNHSLKQRIEETLFKMIEDGSFDKFIKTHKNTRDLFPLSRFKGAKIFELINPFLSKEADIKNKSLWISPDKLK